MRFELLNKENTHYDDITRVFVNRGIKPEEISHYCNVTADDENDPMLLDQMSDGAKMLVRHIKAMDETALLVDCDCDGFTSAAVLYNYLWKLFPNWVEPHLHWFIHEDKEHGLADKVDSIIESGAKFVIVPDAGGGDKDHVARLVEKGIEVLFLDHHDATVESYGDCVVINNQHGNYPNRTLSGVGVVYKFCQYFGKLLGTTSGGERFDPSYLLDLVAVGCVADLMPLTNYETLYYIRYGISHLYNPFLKAVAQLQEYSITKHGGFDPFVIGFYFAPLINATIRVGTESEKQFLFMALLERYGYEDVPSTKRGHKGELESRAEQAARMCSNVRTRQNKLRDTQLARIEELIQEQYSYAAPLVTVMIEPEENMDKNILGLIANILMDEYQRPILLLNHNREDHTWAGSVRNYPYFPIRDLRAFLEAQEGVVYASGHPSAFGICIKEGDLTGFVEQVGDELDEIDTDPLYYVDYIFEANNVDGQVVLDIAEYNSLYGQAFTEPYVAVTNIVCDSNNTQLLSKDKHPTIKITLPDGTAIMKFGSSEEEYNQLVKEDKVVTISVVGTCAANFWAGVTTPQIMVKDYEITSEVWDF